MFSSLLSALGPSTCGSFVQSLCMCILAMVTGTGKNMGIGVANYISSTKLKKMMWCSGLH